MEIESAEFVKSSSDYRQCSENQLPEYAFIGRSNVGKSSLINSLLGNKKLAKTSSTPGKTQLINEFLVNNAWTLTDLPGYGYAKVSKKARKEFSKLITQYILKRKNLVNVFVLVDGRHSPLKNDIEFINFLGENRVPFTIVFTKADKLRGKKIEETQSEYENELGKYWEELPEMYITSAKKGKGTEELLELIEKTNQNLAEN